MIIVVTELSLRFAHNFYKQHLLHVQFHRRNEKNKGFHLISKTPFRLTNPKVIIITTFKWIYLFQAILLLHFIWWSRSRGINRIKSQVGQSQLVLYRTATCHPSQTVSHDGTEPDIHTLYLIFVFFVAFCRKFPDLYKWFKEFLGYKESDRIDPPQRPKDRSQGELAMEIGKQICIICFINFLNYFYRFLVCLACRSQICTAVLYLAVQEKICFVEPNQLCVKTNVYVHLKDACHKT